MKSLSPLIHLYIMTQVYLLPCVDESQDPNPFTNSLSPPPHVDET